MFYAQSMVYLVYVAKSIVAVAGLNGHPYQTWSGRTADVLNPMWLQDFLAIEPGIGPHCRTMIYGYNAGPNTTAGRGAAGYAMDFLSELWRARDELEHHRYLVFGYFGSRVFAAHNLPMETSETKRRIFSFGVPYRGPNVAEVEERVSSHSAMYDRIIPLLKLLRYEMTTGSADTDRFRDLLIDNDIQVVTFYETQAIREVLEEVFGGPRDSVGYNSSVVVPKKISIIGLSDELEEIYAAEGDHFTIIKFTNPRNRAYSTIIGVLRNFLQMRKNKTNETIAISRDEAELSEGDVLDTETPIELTKSNPRILKSVQNQTLRVAVHFGLYDLVRELLKAGVDADMDVGEGETLLLGDMTTMSDRALVTSTIVSNILKHRHLTDEDKDSMSEIIDSYTTPLALAIKRPDIRMIKLLVEAGADPNRRCPNSEHSGSERPLHLACILGDAEVTQYLLENGADINAMTEPGGYTPLHQAACYSGHGLTCGLLINSGADVNATTLLKCETPLHIAAKKGNMVVVSDLVAAGASITATSNDGSTALHAAVEAGNVDVVAFLLRSGGNGDFIDFQNYQGWTALHQAVEQQNTKIIRILLDKGANLEIKTKRGLTAYRLAQKHNNASIRFLLRSEEKNRENSGGPRLG
ncbi:hypothetical protein TWF694_004674 [Orbilia ellipsospora]|uniref:Uncharacterized protein n=1 Tax=Orbilia ellipsospora TaxID=2528407 RepID=A0AAV9WX45_9PEZI